MAAPPLLALRDVRLGYGGTPLFEGATLSVMPGDRLCLVGRNGCGKSTLLKGLAGLVAFDSGERFVQPGIHVGYMEQAPAPGAHNTVGDYVGEGLPAGQAHEDWRVAAVLDGLGVTPDRAASGLSGGEWRRAALARALVAAPEVLLLDEPTNHLDLPTILWLEEQVAAYHGAVVTISHDRAFLRRVSRRTAWLDRGVVRVLDQGFAAFDAWQEQVLAEEENERQRLNTKLVQENRWLQRGVTARRKRNQGRLRALHDLREQRRSLLNNRNGSVSFTAEDGPQSGRRVIEAENITFAHGDRVLVRDFSTRILRGDRVGVIGPNGAGKSTLLKLLLGDLTPDQGTVQHGTRLEIAYFDQHRATLDPDSTPWRVLAGDGDTVQVGGQARHVVAYLRDFLFDERQATRPIHTLSGGECNRLLLARLLARSSNLLVLDEPTNDLDMDTLDLLQEMLADYGGTLLLVSHDRDFLDRLVTSTIAVEGDGVVVESVGGYADYLRQRGTPSGRDKDKTKEKDKNRSQDKGIEESEPKARRAAKLSYKEQRELDGLPTRIEALETEIAALEAELGDAGLFGRDPDRFQAATDRHQAAAEERDILETRWLELEEKQEQLARGEA